MLELHQIESFYPERLRPFKRNILREYLQYKILQSIFEGKAAQKFVFMGGTAIHIVHGMGRFSEDLDFDDRGLTRKDFGLLVENIARNLALEGLTAETDVSFKGAFSADIKILDILFEAGLSGHKQEKILIKVDAEAQGFAYEPERVVINKFDVFCGIAVVPVSVLLAQKFYAILNRKRAMGRDFFDAIFLAGMAKPDFGYLRAKMGITDEAHLKSALLRHLKQLDFKQLARDVEPFVFVRSDTKRIEMFQEWVKGM